VLEAAGLICRVRQRMIMIMISRVKEERRGFSNFFCRL
jgi:hypothetical protein